MITIRAFAISQRIRNISQSQGREASVKIELEGSKIKQKGIKVDRDYSRGVC